MSLSEISATEIAGKIKGGQLSCAEVTEHFIGEQRRWNPKINAVVENRWADAVIEAKEHDALLLKTKDKSTLPSLFGVPMTIKEMISVQGYRSTLGSIHRRRSIQTRDASVVERLRKAGALILGTTNVPELGFWFESENPVYGRTSNPFDLNRTAGGSSGGEAAMIAAGGSPLGLGSDVGGSIRIPAGFCGVYGHKPSNRIVPITGHYPANYDNVVELKEPRYPLTVIGPLCRRAEDLFTAMKVLIGPDGRDPHVRSDFKLGEPVEDWTDANVWILPEPQMTAVGATNSNMAEAVRLTGAYFESLGARVRQMKKDVLKNAALLWSAGLSEVEGRTFEAVLFGEKENNFIVEMFRSLIGNQNYTLQSLLTVLAERSLQADGGKLFNIQKERLKELNELRKKLNSLLTGKNVFILPVHPREAPHHRGTLLRPFDFAMAGIFNTLGFPVTNAPVTWIGGLPQSVQIVSAWGQDHITMSAARTLEFAFGGSRRPALP